MRTGENLKDLGLGEFLDIWKTLNPLKNMDEFDFIKIKNSALQNTCEDGKKTPLCTGRKYLQSIDLTKDTYLQYIKNSQNPKKKQTSQLENEQNTWRDISPVGIYTWQISTREDVPHH